MITSPDIRPRETVSTAYLAFLGDAVYSLRVREHVIRTGGPVGRAHAKSAGYVSAVAQARAAAVLEPRLTDEERDVFRRGRNLHTRAVPKGATVAQYHAATALEAVFGYLHLAGREERIGELMELVFAALPEAPADFEKSCEI